MAVLATGGTIATRRGEDGTVVARAAAEELVATVRERTGADVDVLVEDVLRVGSYRMTLERMAQVAGRAAAHLRAPGTDGVVVTHGTDTLEETAFFVDLFVEGERPVVLTGAQRPADAPDSDGPRNLADAITVATSPEASGLGTVVVFDGEVLPARGVRKVHTVASSAFAAPDGGSLGWVREGRVHLASRREHRPHLDLGAFDAARARVDVVACYPGVDATALRAFAAAGARGLVLEATGAGNATPEICDAVAELSAAGLVVVLSTRVPEGPVAAIYGDGGGADLLDAGALLSGRTRPPQARIALAALLGVHDDVAAVRETFPRLCSA
ncbi:asparaginase [Geodermatophilus dictyosporus]|uniref:asparaginase n=1 Tax=Geodermatophilus dictyosporus TaxID=1523247 RepID=UPI00145C21B8|nr:asparaginase [Geodermatophilus dictyosporus]